MDFRRKSRLFAISTILLISVGSAILLPAIEKKKYSTKELDELMAKVWQKCKTDLENLRGYVFSETEVIEAQGVLLFDLQKSYSSNFRVDYVWALSDDGYLVPSPTYINGKEAPSLTRADSPWDQPGYAVFDNTTGTFDEMRWVNLRQHRQPWLVLETILDFLDYFVQVNFRNRFYPRFKYEPGKYKYVGAMQYEGNRVIEVRYKTESDKRDNIGMKHTVKIAMLIIPEENQLVKVTVTDSLPYQKYEYSMIMRKPGDDWIPSRISRYGRRPSGSSREIRDFHDYTKTGVKARFWLEDVKVKIWYNTDKPQPEK